jgi:hypothetical protein
MPKTHKPKPKPKPKPKTTTADAKTGLRAQFIRALAEYFGGPNQVKMSIKLQMDPAWTEAVTWAKLRGLTPLFGYPTVEEVERVLTRFLEV